MGQLKLFGDVFTVLSIPVTFLLLRYYCVVLLIDCNQDVMGILSNIVKSVPGKHFLHSLPLNDS